MCVSTLGYKVRSVHPAKHVYITVVIDLLMGVTLATRGVMKTPAKENQGIG